MNFLGDKRDIMTRTNQVCFMFMVKKGKTRVKHNQLTNSKISGSAIRGLIKVNKKEENRNVIILYQRDRKNATKKVDN